MALGAEIGFAMKDSEGGEGQTYNLLREMFLAEAAYGCGFYNNDRWLAAYRALRAHAGLEWDHATDTYKEISKTC
jgi:hypothetical protein